MEGKTRLVMGCFSQRWRIRRASLSLSPKINPVYLRVCNSGVYPEVYIGCVTAVYTQGVYTGWYIPECGIPRVW